MSIFLEAVKEVNVKAEKSENVSTQMLLKFISCVSNTIKIFWANASMGDWYIAIVPLIFASKKNIIAAQNL